MNKLQKLIRGYRYNRSWGDGRLEAFYWVTFRKKTFGSMLDLDNVEFVSVKETKKLLKELDSKPSKEKENTQ